jgi:uncharacterized membrane protein
MWIIQHLPEWVFHFIFSAGVVGTIAGFVLSMIPVIKKYGIPIKVISLLVLVLGVYLEGALSDNKEWEFRAKELEAKLAEASAQSATENVKIVEKIVYKDRVIKEQGTIVKQYIDREVVKYDSICPIPKEVVKAHNAAARNEAIGDKK